MKSLKNNSAKNKAVFLDRDGVINIDKSYIHKIEDFELLDKVVEGLKLLRNFKLIIITNQSGIGRGYYTKKDFLVFNNHLKNELLKEGIKINKTYFCPHKPEDNCECRKPKIGLIKQAENDFNLDLSKCFLIGDRETDIITGKNAGCKTILIKRENVSFINGKPDFIANNLVEAADYILK